MCWKANKVGLAAVLGLLGVAAVIATGILGDPERQMTGPAGSGLSTVVDTPPGGSGYEPRPPGRPTVVTLGDLDPPVDAKRGGVPFAPCAVIGWADLPLEVRPAEGGRPRPPRPDKADDDRSACRFDNSATTATGDHPRDGSGSGSFTVTVFWGTTPPLSLDPSSHPGTVAKTFAGRPGVQYASTTAPGQRMCTGLMPVYGEVVAGATVTNARFPTTDPCAVVAAVLDAIAHRVP